MIRAACTLAAVALLLSPGMAGAGSEPPTNYWFTISIQPDEHARLGCRAGLRPQVKYRRSWPYAVGRCAGGGQPPGHWTRIRCVDPTARLEFRRESRMVIAATCRAGRAAS